MQFDVTLRKELKGGFIIEVGNPTDTLVSVEVNGSICAIAIFQAMVKLTKVLEVKSEVDKS